MMRRIGTIIKENQLEVYINLKLEIPDKLKYLDNIEKFVKFAKETELDKYLRRVEITLSHKDYEMNTRAFTFIINNIRIKHMVLNVQDSNYGFPSVWNTQNGQALRSFEIVHANINLQFDTSCLKDCVNLQKIKCHKNYMKLYKEKLESIKNLKELWIKTISFCDQQLNELYHVLSRIQI